MTVPKPTAPQSPVLLDHIVGLTSLRDIELLEFSLLKTINGHLRAKRLVLVKCNRKGIPVHLTEITSEKVQVSSEDFLLDPDFQAAIDNIELHHKDEVLLHTEGSTVTAKTLYENGGVKAILIAETSAKISAVNEHLIDGFMQIYRNFYDVLLESQQDQLTGLPNRKAFYNYIKKILHHPEPVAEDYPAVSERRKAADQSLWIAVVDIDHFKSINDRFGHLYGDEVLIAISQVLRVNLRETDRVFRFGGEEFVVVMKTHDRQGCALVLEKLRQTLESTRFARLEGVTASFGATELTPDIFHLTLLDHADQALFHSKQNGRNRVTFYEDMLASGAVQAETLETGDINLF